jgi:predicted nucleotidyltransferase
MTTKENILNTIKAHKSELSRFGIHEIGLFGSYVRDEQSPESDIDILIDFEPDKESFDNLMATYDYFESIFSSEKVGLVTKNSLSPYLGPGILNEVVYV